MFAVMHLTPDGVNSLDVIKPFHFHNLVPNMILEVHTYLAACVGVVIDESDVEVFTDQVNTDLPAYLTPALTLTLTLARCSASGAPMPTSSRHGQKRPA